MQTNKITLPASFEASESECTWLMAEDGDRHLIWVNLPLPDHYLEIEIVPSNYPGLTMATIHNTADQLHQHILENCGGMLVRKMNLPGVEEIGDIVPDGED
jgi:hypothetical protein